MQEAPTAVHVTNQRLRFVLGQEGDLADRGIDAIGQHEIDDSVLAAERHRGFRLPGGEAFERSAAAVGED